MIHLIATYELFGEYLQCYFPYCQQTRETQALILSPTRELAQQIQKVSLKLFYVLFLFLRLEASLSYRKILPELKKNLPFQGTSSWPC